MNWLDKLERKFGRFYIENLMLYIVIGTGILFAFQYLFLSVPLLQYCAFDRGLILHGQVWRLISFVFMPDRFDPLLMVLWLYFYWFIGSNLEQYWGGYKFNVYYFSGVLFCIIGGFITGYSTVHYLNLSLFLAMAAICPNTQVLLFFFIPVKMKWLALFDVLIILSDFINYGWGARVLILLSLLNFLLFFGGDFFRRIWNKLKHRKIRQSFKK